jgi:hypothetical protein
LVRPWLDPAAETTLFEAITYVERSRSAPSAGGRGLDILIGGSDRDPVAIGLLLPAVQKVRDAAARPRSSGRGARVGFTIDTTVDFEEVDGADLDPEPEEGAPPPSFDLVTRIVDSSPALSDGVRARLAPLVGATAPGHGDVTLKRGGIGLRSEPVTVEFDADDEAALDTWRAATGELSFVFDVRDGDRRVHHRFRLPRVAPPESDGIEVRIAPTVATYLAIGDIPDDAEDPAAVIAVFETHYPAFSARPFAAAETFLGDLPPRDPDAASRSVAALTEHWLGGSGPSQRAATVNALHDAVVSAASHEGLLCWVAMPLAGATARAAGGVFVAAGDIDGDAPYRMLADYYEGYLELGQADRYAFVGGTLEMARFTEDLAEADAETACAAIRSVAAMRALDSRFEDAVDAADWRSLSSVDTALDATSARHLDRLATDLVDQIDTLVAGGVEDEQAAILALDALITLVGNELSSQQATAEGKWRLANTLVTNYQL